MDPTPTQAGLMDELDAEPVSYMEDGTLVAQVRGSGVVLQITKRGKVTEVEAADGTETQPVETDLPPPETEGLPEAGAEATGSLEEPPPTIEGDATELVSDSENPDDYKPPEVALAVRGPEDVFRAMDRADEIAILDELQGRALESMLYSFQSDGKTMTDLTVGGVNETIRQMNERGGTQIGIAPTPPIVNEVTEPDKDGELIAYYRVMVFARDARFPETGRWGTAVEPKIMEKRNGDRLWDKFALTKALNKAQRNALRALIPEDFRQTLIETYLGTPYEKKLKPLGAGTVAQLPPALQDERAQELRVEIHAAYDALKALNRLIMPAGRFNGWLTRVETESHERMEVFRDHLLELAEDERERQKAEAEEQGAA